MDSKIEEKCRWEDCNKPAAYWVAWQPFRAMENNPDVLDEVTISEVNQAVVGGLIDADWLLTCTEHRDDAVEWFKEFQFPEDAIEDYMYTGPLAQVVRVQRERMVPEQIEVLDVETGTMMLSATEQHSEGIEAPYGFKSDGVTPRKKPGRKAAASR